MNRVYINLAGGLSNQIFQYSFGKNIEKKFDVKVTFLNDYISSYGSRNFHGINLQDAFDIDNEYFSNRKSLLFEDGILPPLIRKILSKVMKRQNGVLYFEDQNKFHDFKKDELDKIKYFHGYWQNINYFMDVKDHIKKLKFKLNNDQRLLEIKNEITSHENTFFIHFRRGDYLKNSNTNRMLGVLSDDYYLKCIRKIDSSNAKYFLFSEDYEYAKNFAAENLKNYLVIPSWQGKKDHYDMYLMSLCKGGIIANSTFSWWSAFFGEEKKTIFCPSPWYKSDKYKKINPSLSTWSCIER